MRRLLFVVLTCAMALGQANISGTATMSGTASLGVPIGIVAPTLISYTETSWTAPGSPHTTASVSWQTGDVLVACELSEGFTSTDVPAVPTVTGLTFASQALISADGSTVGSARVSTAVAGSSSSGAIAATNPNTSGEWGLGVWVFRNSGGVGNAASDGTTAHTVSLTPTQAHSAIVWCASDFGAATAGSITPTPTNTRQAAANSPHYTFYVADLTDQAGTGAVSYGATSSGTAKFAKVAVEIKGQ